MPKILIADDNESLRKALRDSLSSQEGWTVCGEATNGRSAVVMAVELKPDVIILDFLMPLLNGIAAAAEISAIMPDVPIVLYTMHMSAQLEREAKKVGIRKVVAKTEPFQTFVAGLEEFLPRGDAPVGPLGLNSEPASSGEDLSANSQGEPQQERKDDPSN
jgi:DNA-binding NarL/FixJ family response regulator